MEQVPKPQTEVAVQTSAQQSYVGMCVTKDGYIRHELPPNGRYDEARGQKQSAYQGSYTLTGNHIDYFDDTGFTADGEFRDGVLYMAAWFCTAKRKSNLESPLPRGTQGNMFRDE